MAEPPSAHAGPTSVTSDVANLPAELAAAAAGKRSAAEAFEGDSVEDLKDKETTLDDVLVSPVGKKSKLLDEDLPDVDDNEEFPLQEDDLDADLAIGLENGENNQGEPLHMAAEPLNMATENPDMEQDHLNMETQQDVDDLAPPEEEESEPPTSQNNEIDIVDVDEDEEDSAEYQTYSQEGEEEEDEDEQETARAIARAQNQRDARQLLQQLDDSARSKLCLTALEKYGEELFYGHEDARDTILVDACAQDSVLSLMRDAIRVRDLYLRGSSAAAPVELDDDDDDEEEETGGYEDEEDEEEGDEEEDKPAGSAEEDDDDEIVVISEEEEEDAEESEAPDSTTFSPGSEDQAGNASHADESDEQEEEVDTEEKAQPAESDGVGDNGEDEEATKEEDAAPGYVGTGEGSTSEATATDTAT